VPAIALALGVSPLSMKAVLASYTLSLAVFHPVSGWIADRFGTRRVFASQSASHHRFDTLRPLDDIHWLVTSAHPAGLRRRMMLPWVVSPW